MNILLLTQFFSETRGGGEYVFKQLAKSLVKNNHKVWIITNKIKEESYSNLNNLNIVFVEPTLSYNADKLPRFSDNIRYTFNAIKESLRIIKKEQIDIIHSNNFAPAISGSILSTITGKPHITAVHDVFSLCEKNYWKSIGKQSNISTLNATLVFFFERMIIRLPCIAIHTVSDATKYDLLEIGAKKPIYVIPNTIEPVSNYHAESDIMQFVYIGRLVFYKNLEVVIKALNIVKKKEPKIKLIIVGNGPHKKTLEELISQLGLESNIEFRGFVSSNQKEELIGRSNALIFPSLCEGFGLVILEAFAQNKPVMVSDVRPSSDIVEHEKNGYVLNPHDEKIWAEHILKMIKNPNLTLEMGKNGFDLLMKSYNQEEMYKKIIEMYKHYCTSK